MAHPSEHAAIFVISSVAALALLLTAIAIGAWRRSRNPGLLFLAAAFGTLCVKGVVTAAALWRHSIRHENLELLGSLFDLLLVVLLLAPLLRR